ncbi:MAG: PAS domain S-box protein, partial [Proteobacteria bacterium]|nr:PAS domain S-box protein [Pseudomonadota bacterium]
SAAPIRNEDGTIRGVILVFRDNTEYYRLQTTLFDRNQLLEAVMDNMPSLLYIKNLEGEFVNTNRAFEGAFNIKKEALLGATDLDLFDKDMADHYTAEDQRVIESGETITWQNEAETAEENRKYLTTKFPLYDVNDQVYAVCGMSLDITEQMQLFAQLENSKKNLQAIIDHAPAVIYVRDLQGRFILANENLSKLLQLPLEKIVGENSYDVMDSETADQHLFHEKLVIETGVSQEFIEEFKEEDGDHHFLSIKYPLFDEHNEIYAIGGISTDITERFQLEQSVRISEQHMRLYREQNPLALIEWNPEFEVMDWNPAAEKLFGYSKEEAMGRSANELIVPKHLQYVDGLRNALTTQSGGEANINQNVTKTGQLIYCQWQNTPITDEAGAVIGIASLINDLTDKQRIETELKAQEVEQYQILNHIADGVITIDEVGTVLSFNHSAELLFGYDLGEVKGNNIAMLMPEPDRSQHDSYLQRYLETGKAKVMGLNRTVTAIRKNGDTFSMRLSVAQLPTSTSGKRRFVGSCVDVTELEQQELQLRQIQKMEALGKLTGGIAHDYNNMLGVILGYVDLLGGKLKEPDLIRYVEQIQKAGQRGASLTNKLLSFSRNKAIESEVVDINELLEEERDMLEKTLTPRIALTMDLESAPWLIQIDKGEFEDALLNLAVNAMHAMGGTGELKLATSNQVLDSVAANELGLPAGEYVLFSIDDSGVGMSATVSARIFDPFYSTKGEGGTGLGLSQVYGFIQRSSGAIRVDSAPTHGSRFDLYFPRCIAPEVELKRDEPKQAINVHGNETILIVDDEPAIRDISQEILTKNGYKVFCAEDGQQALDILKDTRVDLLVSDMIMLGMDGYQLARRVKLQFPQVKIQLVSGYTGDYQPDAMDLELQQQLLTKPVGAATLLQRIRWLLD